MDPQENSHPLEKSEEQPEQSPEEKPFEPAEQDPPISNQDFSLANLEGWKQRFSTLPDLSAQEALAKIEAGEVVKDVKISEVLNLDKKDLEKPVRFEGCLLSQVSARGSHFQGGLEMSHCLVSGEVHLTSKKNEEEVHKTILSFLKLEGSVFEGEFLFNYGEVRGEASFDRCHFRNTLRFDRTFFHHSVSFTGPGTFGLCSFYRANMKGNLFFKDWKGEKNPKVSLDLKNINLDGTLIIRECSLSGALDLSRGRLGKEERRAFLAENSTFEKVDLGEAKFSSEVSFSQIEVTGEFIANPPRQKHGQKAGRSTLFEGDMALMDVKFKENASFHGARFLKYFNVKHTSFQKGATFNQAEFGQVVSFWKVRSGDSLHFRKGRFSGRTSFGESSFASKSSFNEALFEDHCTVFNSEMQGDVFFSSATFERDLKFNKVDFRGGLGLKGLSVGGSLNIINCPIKDRIILTESHINGPFIAPGLSVGTWGSLMKGNFGGDVNLSGLNVGAQSQEIPPPSGGEAKEEVVAGSFYMEGASFQKSLKINDARIRGQLSVDNLNTYGEIEAMRMNIGHNLILSKSYFRGFVRFGGSEIKGKTDSYKARFKEEVSFNSIHAQDLSLAYSSFDGGFTMRSAKIQGTLVMNHTDVDGKIDLSGIEFGRFFFDHLLVDHFLIQRESIGEKISSEREGNFEQAKNEYGILKQAFSMQNQYKNMDWAYYRFSRSRRKAQGFSFNPLKLLAKFIDWLFLDLGFGYGTRPLNIGAIALGIILIFTLLFFHYPEGIIGGQGKPLETISVPTALYMSVIAFASMDYGNVGPDINHWLKFAFSLEGLLGIFLITLFVATISRKIIRT